MRFFSRPLIGPQITWPDPGLSLDNPPFLPYGGGGGVGVPKSPYSAATAAGEGGRGRKNRGRELFSSRHLLKEKKQITQPLQICIGPTIRIGRESWCLPYAGYSNER